MKIVERTEERLKHFLRNIPQKQTPTENQRLERSFQSEIHFEDLWNRLQSVKLRKNLFLEVLSVA